LKTVRSIPPSGTQDSFKFDLALSLCFFLTYTKNKNVEDAMKMLYEQIKGTDCSFYAWLKNDSSKDIKSSKGNICNAVGLVGKFA